MKWLKQLLGRKKDSRHENFDGQTHKPKKSKINDTTNRSDVPNDSFPGGRPEGPRHTKPVPIPHRTEPRHGEFSQATQVYKPSYSVTEMVTSVGDYIDNYNKTQRPEDRIEIDIIVLKGLLDIDQNLTEPKAGSQIKFISNPKKRWRNDIHSAKLERACAKAIWHTKDTWIPDASLDTAVQIEMFRSTERDTKVYVSRMQGLTIRKPPLDYQFCQRVNRFGDPKSTPAPPQPSISELSKIVALLQSYVDHNQRHLEDTQAISTQKNRERGKKYDLNPMAYDCDHQHHRSQGIMVPDKAIAIWQNNYRFRNVHFWLEKVDFESCRISLKKGEHRHLIGHVMIVERSKSRESSNTRSRNESRGGNGSHDSAGTGQRPPSKTSTHKSSDYGSDSGTSTRTRRHGKNSSQSPSQRKPPSTQSSFEIPPKQKPLSHSRPPPSISIDPLINEKRRGKSPGKSPSGRSPSRKSPKRSPRTPDEYHVHQNQDIPPLPPLSYSPHRDYQKSPARPGSSGQRVTPKKSHKDLLEPSTSKQQSSHPYSNSNNGNNSKSAAVKAKKSQRDLRNTPTNQPKIQTQSYSQPYSNNRSEITRLPVGNQSSSPVISPLDPTYDKPWKNETPEQKKERHDIMMEELRREDRNDIRR
ncbi:hypothetical protein SBOR_7830 [Sclerotinia borealis F-4128]|uniref:Uncharacterized protein n=1 Tax=Sclerotinia borealis (strain F-4128) TaxID=1432307 RepID=W9CA94_SCLBF|nr:hypothetical protein SBOR_7830 [Sclerotinia borealis F-4128]